MKIMIMVYWYMHTGKKVVAAARDQDNSLLNNRVTYIDITQRKNIQESSLAFVIIMDK